MHDTWKCTSVTQVNGLRSTSDYDYKIRGDASFSFYSSCDSPEYDQVRLIHTADSRHQLCLTFDGYDMQRLDFHHALQMGPFGLSPFNRVAFCRHFTGYSMSFTQRAAREKVSRSKKSTLYLMRFEFAFLYNCRERAKVCSSLPTQGRLDTRSSFLRLLVSCSTSLLGGHGQTCNT